MVPSPALSLQTTADALFPGTTVRYYYRTGDSLATVVDRSDRFITFLGTECDGRFTYDQIDRLFADDRLEVVLDDRTHVPGDDVTTPSSAD
ncbi:hypothetical protein SAMN04487967_2877 [Natronorubrum sediminis]|uniref:Uncharacterized protein n=1 Tax=Natronorubrum sediminis TaxID=640943 RepID=A0A1H6G4Z0_9EURY|nr:hypothetical protein [Natronorubrum sediminis]SEH16945.1 hypothetical protein SAMN04487967_2877 [Natronorubrum sediminis]